VPTLGRCRIAFYTSIQLTQPNCPRSAQLGHPAPVTPSPNFKKKIVTPSPPPQPHRIQIQIATAGNRVWSAAASGRGGSGGVDRHGVEVAQKARNNAAVAWSSAVAEAAMAQVAAASSSGTWRLAVAAAASTGMARRLVGIFEQLACGVCRGA